MFKAFYRALFVAIIALSSAATEQAMAQPVLDDVNFSQLPPCNAASEGRAYWVKDNSAASGNCAAGGGSKAICVCDGTNFTVQSGSGGSSSNSFETIDAPSGTDPVADSGTDTLDIDCTVPLVCTGTAGTDKLDFTIDSTASLKCARFDATGLLVPATGDCESGDTNDGSAMIFDIGDDGSNESLNVTEFATIRDDYSVITEPSNDKILIDFYKIPPYQQYDPDRAPSSVGTGGWTEEYTGDAETQTWTGQNLSTTTKTLELDTAYIEAPKGSGENVRAYTTTIPDGSTTDFVISMKFSMFSQGSFNSAGIFIIATGTAGTPTLIYFAALLHDNIPGDYDVVFYTKTSYTSASTTFDQTDTAENFIGPFWLQLRYTSSTKSLLAAFSTDGVTWKTGHGDNDYSAILANHPTTIGGYYVNAASTNGPVATRIYYYRVRTDAAGTSTPFPVGE